MVIRTLSAGRTVRPFVFLNACQVDRQGRSLGTLGGFASAFLARGAGVFVTPLGSVGDHPAFTFGGALYNELLTNGKRFAAAVTDARNAASSAVDPRRRQPRRRRLFAQERAEQVLGADASRCLSPARTGIKTMRNLRLATLAHVLLILRYDRTMTAT